MDNQRILLYAALGFVLLLLWQNWQLQYGPQIKATPPQTVSQPQSSGIPALPTGNVSPTDSQLPIVPVPIKENLTPSDSQRIKVTTDVLQVEIDSLGGSISQVLLLDYPVSINEKDIPFTLMSDNPLKYFVFQTGLQSTNGVAPTHQSQYTYESNEYKLADGEESLSVPLTWTSKEGVKVTKTLIFKPNSYRIDVHYKVENQSTDSFIVNQYRQLQRKPVTDDETQQFIYNYIGGIVSTTENPYEKLSFDDMEEADLNLQVKGGWQAMIQHYFVGAVIPDKDEVNTFYSKALNSPKRYILGSFSQATSIATDATGEFNATLYVGPKDQDRLSAIADKLNLVVDFGWLTVLANPIFWLLKKIHSFVGNWGWSIIILTMIIKGIFYKLSEASYKSMARMRRLQPKLQALKEKYGSDRQIIGQKTMELYKTEKVNPLGGCLPMIIQIPVFIALYWVLLESVELRQAPWILWIKDMSIKDPYYILPVVMGITMFLQQKLSPAMTTDPIQAKVFMFLPLVFTIFFAFFPAGLVLYWVVNNTLTIAQQYYITRYVVGDGK